MIKEWNGPKIQAAVLSATVRGLNKISADIVREAKLRAPVGVTGHYRRSINYARPAYYSNRETISTLIGVEAGENEEAGIIAQVLEGGRRKGAKMPPRSKGSEPLTAFELWVQRKIKPKRPPMRSPLKGGVTNLQGRVSRADKSAAVFQKTADDIWRKRTEKTLIRGVAYVVARKIKERGLLPRRIISVPFERISPHLPEVIKADLVSRLNRIK